MAESNSSVTDLEARCNGGDSEAMRILGHMYLAGESVVQNKPKARKLLTDSAAAGDLQAIYELVEYYIAEQPEEWSGFVEYWLRQAVIAGDDAALSKLGRFYYVNAEDSDEKAAVFYTEYMKRTDEGCEQEQKNLEYILEHKADPGWKCYADLLEVLAERGNRDAKHKLRREEVPEPEDDIDFETLMSQTFELPEVTYEEKVRQVRRWGRSSVGRRALTSVLYDMGIEFTKSSNGLIKTKKGEEIREDIEKLIAKGYKFKYSYKTDKWTIMDKPKE